VATQIKSFDIGHSWVIPGVDVGCGKGPKQWNRMNCGEETTKDADEEQHLKGWLVKGKIYEIQRWKIVNGSKLLIVPAEGIFYTSSCSRLVMLKLRERLRIP